MTLKELIYSRRNYFIGYSLFVAIITIILILYPKTEGHLFVNGMHSPATDLFFKRITHLGDGITVVILGLVFLLLQIKKGLIFWLSGGLSGALTQFFKRVVFDNHYRPVKFFGIHYPDIELPLVAGIDMHSNFSFPSGHTTAAFAMMTAASLLTKNKKADIIFILSAIIISFSRVYLSQHFLEDILAGSFIGLVMSVIIFLIFHSKHLENKKWLNHKILPSRPKENNSLIK